jgi:hypothetical protein
MTHNSILRVILEQTMADKTPDERAAAAAEALAAEGAAVTARAVQQRARVDMNVASPAAREWNARQAQAREVPPLPDSVEVRIQGMWREAVEAARAEHQVERDGWAARIKVVEDDRDGALEDATRIRGELDRATARNAELEEALEQALAAASQAQARTAAAEAHAAAAEARAAAAEGVAAGLREGLSALSSKMKN